VTGASACRTSWRSAAALPAPPGVPRSLKRSRRETGRVGRVPGPASGEQPPCCAGGLGGQARQHAGEGFWDRGRRVTEPDKDLALVVADDVIGGEPGPPRALGMAVVGRPRCDTTLIPYLRSIGGPQPTSHG